MRKKYIVIYVLIALVFILLASYILSGKIKGEFSVKFQGEYLDASDFSVTFDNKVESGDGYSLPVLVSKTEERLKYTAWGIYDTDLCYLRLSIPNQCIREGTELQNKDIQCVITIYVSHEQLKTYKCNTEIEIKKVEDVYKAYVKSNCKYPNGNEEEYMQEIDISENSEIEIFWGP